MVNDSKKIESRTKKMVLKQNDTLQLIKSCHPTRVSLRDVLYIIIIIIITHSRSEEKKYEVESLHRSAQHLKN